jgi:hypothetical protein
MTTITMNALNTRSRRAAPAFKTQTYVQVRAAMPDGPAEASLLARTLDVVSHAALAAVPFGAIAWMFLAH